MVYLAKFDPVGLEGYLEYYPFAIGEVVLCLGEIENMPGHVAVAKKNGTVHFGFHPQNFPRFDEQEMCVTFDVPPDAFEDDDEPVRVDGHPEEALDGPT